MDCAILKAFYDFKVTRAHEGRSQFLFQNVQNEIFVIFKMFKNNMNFTTVACGIIKLAIERTPPHSLHSYVVSIVGYYYALIIEGL